VNAAAVVPDVAGVPAIRIEEAGLNALQTQRQLFYDGWLLRLSAGKARRARSVNAHFGSTLPLADKIAYCERVFARHGLPLLFRMTPFAQPAGLASELAARGFAAFDETLVQALALDRAVEAPPAVNEAVVAAADAATFADAVCDLRDSPPTQRDALRERLLHSPLDAKFVLIRVAGRVVCAAQVAVDDQLAGIFDVVTAADARGRGHATRACAELLSWAWQHGARVAYLQVDAANAPALAVYRRFGFATVYSYHYCARPQEME
jgi:ribosomal protein S18 acetylase RimI-like enzyme